MRKLSISLMVGLLLAGGTLTASAENENKGGFMGFIAGCCFGMRAGAAYNDGKDMHWREWLSPLGLCVWNGIDSFNGKTTADYSKAYGTSFF